MAPITELTIDDFQHIFVHLDYSDLINLSDCNFYLRNVVKSYLDLMFSERIVIQCSKSLDLLYFQKTFIKNFRFILRFVRIFGDQFKILIFWVVDPQKCRIMNTYLNRYCSYLNTLIFRSLRVNFVFKVHNNLENLFFEFSELSFSYQGLVRFFPNLKRLYFYRLLFSSQVGNSMDFPLYDSYSSFIHVFCANNWDDYLVERQKFLWLN